MLPETVKLSVKASKALDKEIKRRRMISGDRIFIMDVASELILKGLGILEIAAQ